MLPVLGGEGSKSAKNSTLISRLLGRTSAKERSASPTEGESPRNNRAGGGILQPTAANESSAASSKANLFVSPRQPGAAVTRGDGLAGKKSPPPSVSPPTGSNNAMSPDSPRSKRLLFATTPSTKQLQAAKEDTSGDSTNGRVAAMLDHNHMFKRSHTTDLVIGGSSRALGAKLTPLTTATVLANVGGSSTSTSPTPARKPAESIKADAIIELDPSAIESKSSEELRKLYKTLQKETQNLKKNLEDISGSGSSGRKASPSLIVEFAEPRHQQRPSMIAQSLEQIKAGIAAPPNSRPSVAANNNVAAGVNPMSLDEEDSGFLTDDDDTSKSAVKVGANGQGASMQDFLNAKEAKEAEEARKKKEKEAKEKEAREKEAAAAAAAAAAAQAAAAKQAISAKADSQGKQAAPRKYKLLSIHTLLAPSMRREEWALHQFVIDKKLHAGYASEVYKGKDIQSGEAMAIKVYNLNALGELNKVQLIREIRLHGSFVHRNIIELYVAFQENYRVVLAQKYAEGGDLLRALHKAGGRLTEKSAVQMVIQPLLNCLVYLHTKGITHRDIKPENILFDGEGVLKLADFGLAINLTEENAVTRAGTLHYMAPEVVKNPLKDHPDDFKNETRFHYNSVVDSWAVGCLAFELIVGFPPFMAETQQQVVKNINSKEVCYPKKMSEECVDFVKAALQRDPQDRATSHELIKHPWITLHMRRNSSRQLNFEAQPGAVKVVADFTTGTALAKVHNAAHKASKQAASMAPF